MSLEFCLYGTRVVEATGKTSTYENTTYKVFRNTDASGLILVPQQNSSASQPLRELFTAKTESAIIAALQKTEPSQPQEPKGIYRRGVPCLSRWSRILEMADLLIWAQHVTYIRHRNSNNIPTYARGNQSLVYTDEYLKILHALLHALASHWNIQPEQARSRLEEITKRNFALGRVSA